MKLFANNAAALLFEKVSSLRHVHTSWRCIQLRLSAVPHNNPKLGTHFVLRNVSDALGEEDAYVYLCQDGDIFILFQGRAQGILRKLGGRLADLDSHELFKLYDLHRDWAFFFAICYRKSLQKNDTWPAAHIPARLGAEQLLTT